MSHCRADWSVSILSSVCIIIVTSVYVQFSVHVPSCADICLTSPKHQGFWERHTIWRSLTHLSVSALQRCRHSCGPTAPHAHAHRRACVSDALMTISPLYGSPGLAAHLGGHTCCSLLQRVAACCIGVPLWPRTLQHTGRTPICYQALINQTQHDMKDHGQTAQGLALVPCERRFHKMAPAAACIRA